MQLKHKNGYFWLTMDEKFLWKLLMLIFMDNEKVFDVVQHQ